MKATLYLAVMGHPNCSRRSVGVVPLVEKVAARQIPLLRLISRRRPRARRLRQEPFDERSARMGSSARRLQHEPQTRFLGLFARPWCLAAHCSTSESSTSYLSDELLFPLRCEYGRTFVGLSYSVLHAVMMRFAHQFHPEYSQM